MGVDLFTAIRKPGDEWERVAEGDLRQPFAIPFGGGEPWWHPVTSEDLRFELSGWWEHVESIGHADLDYPRNKREEHLRLIALVERFERLGYEVAMMTD